MRILITGGTGFVGKSVVPYLYKHTSKEICLLVRDTEKAINLFPSLKLSLISSRDINWTNQVSIYSPDVVLHLAAYFTGEHSIDQINNLVTSNILFTTQLLEAISNTSCNSFINIGTFTEYMHGAGEILPNNLYSATKTAERPIIQYYQSISSWKWFNVIVYSPYGRKNANKKVLDYLIDSIDSKDPVAFSPGEQVLDFIHVDDIADFFHTLIKLSSSLKERFYQFHLGTGEGHSLREVGEVIKEVWQKPLNACWGGRMYNPADPMYSVAPISKSMSLLNWKTKISLKEGLEILKKDIMGGALE